MPRKKRVEIPEEAVLAPDDAPWSVPEEEQEPAPKKLGFWASRLFQQALARKFVAVDGYECRGDRRRAWRSSWTRGERPNVQGERRIKRMYFRGSWWRFNKPGGSQAESGA